MRVPIIIISLFNRLIIVTFGTELKVDFVNQDNNRTTVGVRRRRCTIHLIISAYFEILYDVGLLYASW